MHASTDPVKAKIEPHGGLLLVPRADGLASVIDAGVGQYTLVFDQDCDTKDYVAVCTTDTRGSAHEREELGRTKSEYPISVEKEGKCVDASVNAIIFR